ncbi:branched-chain amino acid ABC transporter permease [Leucobacter rhizosphaerae]|uniref:Branched-chain amino acid ABC transporter permease n=1 Tax=Leucobacter rhizosphaerae TaxID=2932245 RepID=A0ABY4FUU0_9MICO|nr:branched-chain amino acid ABC transporter permease [Leucobacter rhizosphaerae]UOQ60040.1 branched-chain amino acid ABC transporter permease [Leucobacter rhizosphaerae]
MTFLQALIDATSAGAVYALAALGIGLVFGVMRLANFANGELITGAGYALILLWPVSWPLAIVASIVVAVALALFMDAAVFRWIRSQPPATLLIASFGVSILLQRVYDGVFGTNVLSAAVAPALASSVTIGGLRVNLISVVSIVLGAVLLVGMHVFLTRTRMGLQVRAASEDFRAARVLGIRAGSVIALTFALSGILAAAIAFVLTAQSGSVGPTFGVQVTLFALIGSAIGGLGRLGGSVFGGFIVGFAVSMFTTWLPDWINDFRIAFVYLLVAVVLVIAPNGLFAGRHSKERT